MAAFPFLFILAASFSKQTFAQRCKVTQRSEHGFVLVGHVYKSFTVDRLVSCYIACNSQPACQSLNYRFADKTCQFNNETKVSRSASLKQNEGFLYADNPDRALLGSVSFKAAKSCQHIIQSGESTGDGEYWVDLQGNGSPFKVFCDMTTDGGGWLLVLNFVMTSSQPSDWNGAIETTYQGISNYGNGGMAITKSAMNKLKAHAQFTQLRFHCSKKRGTTFHVKTTLDSKGEDVVRYFSGERDILPDSCGSFVRMEEDNSRLAQNCTRWGNDFVTGHYAGKWGHVTRNVGEDRLYNYAAFEAFKYHWTASVSNDWLCDDAVSNNLSTGDFWKIYVR